MPVASLKGENLISRFHKRWEGMIQRCTYPKDKRFEYYSKRGIAPEWLNYENFKRDMLINFIEHVGMHGVSNTTLDRIDNNKGYSKSNCRWATWEVQYSNRSKIKYTNPDKYETRRCRICNSEFRIYKYYLRVHCRDEKCKENRKRIYAGRRKERELIKARRRYLRKKMSLTAK